ncbi:unnamed protein product [Didymodactylos carnosus]|uniref:Uncharacterized protein n=1 Tax=Didymodactylos carnosus TaxID=1234261 RepID=A0A815DX77_9BILA|nr:unnamed protein product [Didymodactylos carnosus]CAF1303824.1 unnamed protein product [Didymodactylos carnosus]CAF3851649.1 unnamed protein product [Didymodactylos carnosus]CAF4133240.1 unnamed protein product [Didymodactylos carnosus]
MKCRGLRQKKRLFAQVERGITHYSIVQSIQALQAILKSTCSTPSAVSVGSPSPSPSPSKDKVLKPSQVLLFISLLFQQFVILTYIQQENMLKWAVVRPDTNSDAQLSVQLHTLDEICDQQIFPCLVRLYTENSTFDNDNYCLLLTETCDPYLVVSNETERFAVPTSFDGKSI